MRCSIPEYSIATLRTFMSRLSSARWVCCLFWICCRKREIRSICLSIDAFSTALHRNDCHPSILSEKRSIQKTIIFHRNSAMLCRKTYLSNDSPWYVLHISLSTVVSRRKMFSEWQTKHFYGFAPTMHSTRTLLDTFCFAFFSLSSLFCIFVMRSWRNATVCRGNTKYMQTTPNAAYISHFAHLYKCSLCFLCGVQL